MNNDVMILACGVTLQLQAVQESILQDLMLEFGDGRLVSAFMRQPELLKQLSGDQKMQALAATGKLFTYCAGWGVATNPPDDGNELMELLGRDTAADKPHLRRANWVRTITSQQERGELIGRVMALAFAKRETAAAEQVSNEVIGNEVIGNEVIGNEVIAELTKQLANGQAARIAELEAQLKALQANGHTAVVPEGAS